MRTPFLLALTVFTALAFGTFHFQSRYASQKQLTAQAEQKLAAQNRVIEDLTSRQRDVAALDARYAQELTDAQLTIENLQRDVAAGTKRLRLAAGCPNLPAGASAARVDDAARARLTDAAERNYFSLRNRIDLATRQIAGLQDYIRLQCLRTP